AGIAFPDQIVVRHRVDQHLHPQVGVAGIAGHQCYDGGQVRPRTVAGDGEAGGVDVELGAFFPNPTICRPSIVHGRREFVFRCQPVIDGDDHGLRAAADVPGDDVVRVQVAEDMAAAVKIDDGGEGAVAFRPVHAHRNV